MAAKRLVEARATKNQIPRQTPLVQTPARRQLPPRAAGPPARPPACGAPTRAAAAHAHRMAEGRSRAAAWTLATGRHREETPPLSATSRQVLGLGPTATEAEVRKAYKSLCLAHHPDKHAAGTAEAQTRAKFRFTRIQAAYAKMSSAAGSLPSYRSPFGRSAWGEYE